MGKFIDNYNVKLNDEIVNLITSNPTGSEEILQLEKKLNEKAELLSQKELELSKKINEVENEKFGIENYKAELQDEYQAMLNQIRNIQYGIEANGEDTVQDLKILIFGNAEIHGSEIYRVFNSTFLEKFGEELNKKCIDTNYLGYNKSKNSKMVEKILNDKYDYIIVGQNGHSTKGKESSMTYKNLAKEKNLKAMVFENYRNPITLSLIKELAVRIIDDWDSQFE